MADLRIVESMYRPISFPETPDPLMILAAGNRQAVENRKIADAERKARNMQKAQQLLVQRMQSDPGFASRIGQNVGLVFPALTPQAQSGLIETMYKQSAQDARDQAKLAQKQAEVAAKGTEIPAILLNTMLNKFEPDSVGRIMQSMKAPPEQIKAFQEAKRIAQPGAEIISDEFGTKFIKQPTGALVPYPKPEKQAEPKMYPVETVDPVTGKPIKKLFTANQLQQGVQSYEKPTEEKAPKEQDYAKQDYMSAGKTLQQDKFVQDAVAQSIAATQPDAYAQVDKNLQEDPSIPADSKKRMRDIFGNVQGIGFMYSFMHNLDRSVVRPSELDLIKAAALNAGMGSDPFERGVERLKKWWRGQESTLDTNSGQVLSLIAQAREQLAYGKALDNMTKRAKLLMSDGPGGWGKKQGASLLISNVGDADIVKAAITAASQQLDDEGMAKMMPSAIPEVPLKGGIGNIPVSTPAADNTPFAGPKSVTIDEFKDAFGGGQ